MRQTRWRVTVTAMALMAAAVAAVGGSASVVAAPVPVRAYCATTNGSSASPLDSVAPDTAGVYVSQRCLPSLGWLSPLGDLLAPENARVAAPHVVAARDGGAYLVSYGANSSTAELEEVNASGRVAWTLPLPFGGTLVGNAQVLVVQSRSQAAIIDPLMRHIAVVSYPDASSVRADGGFTQTRVYALGHLVIVTTNYGQNDTIAGVSGPSKALPTRVQIYDSSARLVHRFSVPDRPLWPVANDSFDQTWVQVVGSTAYILYSDVGNGRQAGLYRLGSGGRLQGPYAVPAPLTDIDSGSFLALPDGELIVADTVAGARGCASAIGAFRWERRRLRSSWRTTIDGCNPVPDGADVVLTVQPGILDPSPSGLLNVVSGTSGRSIRRFATGTAATSLLAAGPFGFVMWGRAPAPPGGGCQAATAGCLPPEPSRPPNLDRAASQRSVRRRHARADARPPSAGGPTGPASGRERAGGPVGRGGPGHSDSGLAVVVCADRQRIQAACAPGSRGSRLSAGL